MQAIALPSVPRDEFDEFMDTAKALFGRTPWGTIEGVLKAAWSGLSSVPWISVSDRGLARWSRDTTSRICLS